MSLKYPRFQPKRAYKLRAYKNKSIRTTMRLNWIFWTFWDVLGHFERFWDNSENFLTSFEHLDSTPSHLRPFSPVIGSLKKRITDGRTDPRTDPLIEMRGRN